MGVHPYEVVISGLAGKFPNCRNVEEFKEKLFSKEMLLIPDEKRWNPVEYDKPYMTGKIPDVDKFDTSFFGITARLQKFSDPVMGPTMEASIEAMVDAGVNPYAVKGRNVSVVVASSLSDAEMLRCFDSSFLDGQAMQGLARTMFANRISYAFNFTGPSYNLDSSWVSAVQGLEMAVDLVGQGHVEGAVVTCVNLTFHSSLEQEYMDIDPGLVSATDKCAPFDAQADGFLRSEGTVSFYVQRAQDAKRHYCTVLNSQTRCITGTPTSFTAINPSLENFFRDFYTETKINPKDVSYVEAFGFCHKDRDTQELNAVSNVFCDKKPYPLLIGCGTGNYGNSETASGFVSLTKAIIALEEGMIPPTINYRTPNPNVRALISGRLKPVTETTELPGDLVAVNTLNFSGNVAHTLLRRNNKPRTFLGAGELPKDGLPRLCILQARNEEGANYIVKKVSSGPLDTHFVSLINDVFKVPIQHYLWRGYSVIPGPHNKSILETKEVVGEVVRRPVWYVFSGMGSQWPGMARGLVDLPPFAAALDRCDQALRPLGIDIRHILTSTDPHLFDNVLNCFVGLTAVQICLTDCLQAVGVRPDGMIGHSAGETCCGYADGCFTLEQTIVTAYYRGRATLEAQKNGVDGTMAAIGLGYEAIKDSLPPSVDVACHNAPDSCTVSGPVADVTNYVDKLKREGVFAKTVNVAGVAYHSRYIKQAGPILLSYLKNVIPSPKPRSKKWISTSQPECEWDSDAARLCSAQYMVNNLVSPVLFEQGCRHIPKNAIIIEVSPHGLLQAILRRSISPECINVPLTSKTAQSNLHYLLQAFGKLHLNNVDVDVNHLFPPVEYPVARGTPPLSPLVTWDHQDNRNDEFRSQLKKIIRKSTTEKVVPIGEQAPGFELWRDHLIDNKVVIPVMQFLVYPWEMVFTSKRLKIGNCSVVFEDVVISEHVSIKDEEQFAMAAFLPSSFTFEVCHDMKISLRGKSIVSGKLREANTKPFIVPTISSQNGNIGNVEKICSNDIYSVLDQLRLQLGSRYRIIKQIIIHENESMAKIKWTSDIIVFVDALFTFLAYLGVDKNRSSLLLPTSFIKLTINMPLLSQTPFNSVLEVYYDKRCNRLVCQAVELLGITFRPAPCNTPACLAWKQLTFSPYFDSSLSLKDFLRTSVDLAKEADLGSWMKFPPHFQLLFLSSKSNEPTIQYLENIVRDHPQICTNVLEVDVDQAAELLKTQDHQSYLLVGECAALLALSQSVPTDKVYCVTVLRDPQDTGSHLRPILYCNHQDQQLVLLKKISSESPAVLSLEGRDWLHKLRVAMVMRKGQTVALVTTSLAPRQVLPKLADHHFARYLRIFFVQRTSAPQFSSASAAFSSQLRLGLPVNILADGAWGCLRSVSIDIQQNNLNSFFNRSDTGIDINYVGLNPPTFDQNPNLDLAGIKCVDYSGTDEAQRPIMGVAQYGAGVQPDPTLRWPVPYDWTLGDAVTVPVVYGLAYYCIVLKAKMQAGETVLIHSGMSPIGQAMIYMALRAKANVITFVESAKEEGLLSNRFPDISPSHILTKSNEDMDIPVKKLTKGKGAEVIINCLSGRDMQSTLKVMALDCRLLHLGRIGVEDRESIGMLVFLKRTSVYGITVENLLRCSEDEKSQIQRGVLEGIMSGDLRPLKRKTISSLSRSEVLEFLEVNNMEEKTVLYLKEESVNNKSFQFNPQHFVIIAGTSSHFWVEVVSWVISHGGQNIIVLTTERLLAFSNFHKVNKLICNHGSTIILCPLSTFDSLQDGTELIKDLLRMRPIDSVICVNMDGSRKQMENLDLASRKAVPSIRHFVDLLGQGAGVCESRALSNLPVCSIQSEVSSLQSPARILPYLSTLLSDTTCSARFLTVRDSRDVSSKSDTTISLVDIKEHLPQNVAELERLGSNLSHTQMEETPSLSPRYEHIKHQLLPFFVIPGISRERIEPLTRRLMHPVFCPQLPPSLPSVETCASYLLKKIEAIQNRGTYNLLADSWSGVVALHLASLLEARGHQVVVFLLDADPSLLEVQARLFWKSTEVFASEEFLTYLLGLQGNVLKGLSDLSSWKEQLDVALEHLQSTLEISQLSLDCIRRYLTSLKTQLTNIINYKPQQLKLNANVHLIQTREASDLELSHITQICLQRPQLHIMENENLTEVIRNPKTASIVNENAVFTWNV